MTTRSRRAARGNKSLSAKLAALEEFSKAKSGASRLEQFTGEDDDKQIYDEVTEQEYQAMLDARKSENGFVVDDGVSGYADTGEEIWENDGSERTGPVSKVAMAPRSRNKQAAEVAMQRVSAAFKGGRGYQQVGPGSKKRSASEQQDDDIDDLLSEMKNDAAGNDITSKRAVKQNFHEVAMFGSGMTVQKTEMDIMEAEETGNVGDEMLLRVHGAGAGSGGGTAAAMRRAAGSAGAAAAQALAASASMDDLKYVDDAPEMDLDAFMREDNSSSSSSSSSTNNKRKAEDDVDDSNIGSNYTMDDGLSDSDDEVGVTAAARLVKQEQKKARMASSSSVVKPESHQQPQQESSPSKRRRLPESAPAFEKTGQDWLDTMNEINAANAASSSHGQIDQSMVPQAGQGSPVRDDGSMIMYWIDAYEDSFHSPGDIYLFGRALLPDGKSVSCCVTVHNVQRNIYFLPRPYALTDPYDDSTRTTNAVTAADVYKEVAAKMKDLNVGLFKTKAVDRRYCFDKDTLSSDQPPEKGKYMKVVYSAKDRRFDRGPGKTYSHVFGTGSSCLELFLMKRDLMGPSWIVLNNVKSSRSAISWCRHEYIVEDQKQVQVLKEADAPTCLKLKRMAPPTMKVLSLAMQTVTSKRTHQPEIVSITGMSHESTVIDGPTSNTKEVTHFTVVRALQDTPLPFDFKSTLKATKKDQMILEESNERALLNRFITKLHKLDPDVIVGHGLHNNICEILITRMRVHNVSQWSKIGRLRKSKIPQAARSSAFGVVDRGVACGRLMCDTQVSAQELVREKTYTLSHMVKAHLGVARREYDDTEVRNAFATSKDLIGYVNHMQNDAWLTLELMHSLVVLPLTRQLTALCGNLWNRSLRSARAERVEYYLLHKFHSLKYIVPEKYTSKERLQRQLDEDRRKGIDPNETKAAAARRKKKPDYAGGLVLEPERGFYDQFVLLLDFNSLYPSIIQEYNICFTTVKHAEPTFDLDHGEMPDLPDANAANGILPKVIKRLIDRRYAVKKMIKSETCKKTLLQLDVRQKALKLVANSMYGCLGFGSSRFYCKPLAAMITSQGRTILQDTKDLTETMGYRVIYGDTDSIMVYTGERDLVKAKQIAKEVTKASNDKYRLLELAIDGIYAKMLLLRKKKYAALMIHEHADGRRTLKPEFKGLDLVRRDWCALSKNVGEFVLKQLLGEDSREVSIEKIHDHLRQLKTNLDHHKVPLEKFIITKGMTKDPKDYPDNKSLPHVQVALKMIAAGRTVRVGAFIPYIICKSPDGSKQSMAERAYHPSDVTKAGSTLEIDYNWYLNNQVLPPTHRLLDVIPETTPAFLAECLGLDGSRFTQQVIANDDVEDDDGTGTSCGSYQDDAEKYKLCEPLKITCQRCKVTAPFGGVYQFDKPAGPDGKVLSGLQCSTPGCRGLVDAVNEKAMTQSITNSLAIAIRTKIDQYYKGYTQCNESSCRNQTRQLSVSGRCIQPRCPGTVVPMYTAAQLYTQLSYYSSLFDVEHAERNVVAENKRLSKQSQNSLQVKLDPVHARVLRKSHAYVEQYLNKSAYRFVDLKQIFAFTHRRNRRAAERMRRRSQ